jgi:hypothetical protein
MAEAVHHRLLVLEVRLQFLTLHTGTEVNKVILGSIQIRFFPCQSQFHQYFTLLRFAIARFGHNHSRVSFYVCVSRLAGLPLN